jgi:hypothetical protein
MLQIQVAKYDSTRNEVFLQGQPGLRHEGRVRLSGLVSHRHGEERMAGLMSWREQCKGEFASLSLLAWRSSCACAVRSTYWVLPLATDDGRVHQGATMPYSMSLHIVSTSGRYMTQSLRHDDLVSNQSIGPYAVR